MWDTKACILEMFLCFYDQYGRSSVSYRDFLREILYWYEKTYFKSHECSCDDDVSTERMITAVACQEECQSPESVPGDNDANLETSSNSSSNSSSCSSLQQRFSDNDEMKKSHLAVGVDHTGVCVFPGERSATSTPSLDAGAGGAGGPGVALAPFDGCSPPAHVKVELHRGSDEAPPGCCPANGLSTIAAVAAASRGSAPGATAPGPGLAFPAPPCAGLGVASPFDGGGGAGADGLPVPAVPMDAGSPLGAPGAGLGPAPKPPPPPPPHLPSPQQAPAPGPPGADLFFDRFPALPGPGTAGAAGVGALPPSALPAGAPALPGPGKEQRLFECFVCGRHFSRSDNLQRHVRIHTGDRPFECQACHLRFRRKDCLKTHMKSHHGNELAPGAAGAPEPNDAMDIDAK